MECHYTTGAGPYDESLVILQHLFDAFIAMAFFSVPLQLIYFMRIAPISLDKRDFVYFGTAAVFYGANFLTSLWRYSEKSKTAALVILAVKISTVVISLATSVIMIYVIPHLLSLRERELILRNGVEALSKELSTSLREHESRRLIINLVQEIRSTLDGQIVAESSVLGLAQVFDLEECALWFPTQTNRSLQLSYSLTHSIQIGSTVPIKHPVVSDILNSVGVVRIPHTCPLVRTSARRSQPLEVVAIRVPLWHVPCTNPDMWIDTSVGSYAVMVLALPSDSVQKFGVDQLELVEAVAQEVATSLAHASAFEESRMASDHMMEQNSSLELAVHDLTTAFHASSHLLSGILHQMLTPLRAMTLLSSLMLHTRLTPQQRAMAEQIVRSSVLLETQMTNQREIRRLEDGTLQLNTEIFNVSAAFKQVIDMIKPAAAVKKLLVSLVFASDLPVYAVGDHEKLMQIVLNVVGNAVKFTKEGRVSVTVSVARSESHRDWRPFKLFLVSSEEHFYLKVQVEDFGHGIDPQEMSKVFNRFKDPNIASNRSTTSGLGLAISKRLLKLMGGRIWVESNGLNEGCTATIIVKLGTFHGISATS